MNNKQLINQLIKSVTYPHQYLSKPHSLPTFVKICQVGPRDGLQNQPQILPTPIKVQFINLFQFFIRLSQTGIKYIEAGSFVSPKMVPQMSNSEQVFISINKAPGISYCFLVPNQKGMDQAIKIGIKEIAIFTSSTQTFAQNNLNCSIQQSFQRFKTIVEKAKQNNIKIKGYISMVLGCPFEGQVETAKVKQLTQRLLDLGCYQVSLGDTIGKGTPQKTQILLNQLRSIPKNLISLHFHDTYGNALSNIIKSLEMGYNSFDSSVGGLGGCPFSNNRRGNVCTQSVVFMLKQLGIETGIDFQKLQRASQFIFKNLNKKYQFFYS